MKALRMETGGGEGNYLKSSSSKVDTSTSYRLWLKSDKHIGSKAVVHVIPEKHPFILDAHSKAYYTVTDTKLETQSTSLFFLLHSSNLDSDVSNIMPLKRQNASNALRPLPNKHTVHLSNPHKAQAEFYLVFQVHCHKSLWL